MSALRERKPEGIKVMMSKTMGPPICECCGPEYKRAGCVRGSGGKCHSGVDIYGYCRACLKCPYHCDCGCGKGDFPMLDGPRVPVEFAKEIYRVYQELYGNDQGLKRIRERGGFGYEEIKLFMGYRAERLAKVKS